MHNIHQQVQEHEEGRQHQDDALQHGDIALKDRQIDLAAGNATDGLIPALDLFVLEDDRHYFPPYEAVPVMREQVIRQHPEVGRVLAELAGKISDEEMQRLNYAVDGQHRDAAEVVREFLRSKKRVQ